MNSIVEVDHCAPTLRSDPSKEEICRRYFGSATLEEVEDLIRSNNVLSKHWDLKSHFTSIGP